MNKSNIYISLVIACSLLFSNSSIAQETLSLEAAVQTALANNHQIQIRQYDVEMRAEQVDPAMVGRRPTIDLNASYELGWSDANIETLALGPGAEGTSIIELDGISNDIIIGPQLNMVLLDGKAGKYRLEQLGTLSQLAQLQLQQTIEQTIANVSAAYLQVALQQSLMDITQQSITLSQDRLNRVQQDATYGTSSSLQKLQVEVDLKTDSASLRNLVLNYENARRNLNQLMGKPVTDVYQVADQLTINTDLQLLELERDLRERNLLLKLGDRNVQLANLDVQLNQAAHRPSLQAYANLNLVYLQDKANFLQSNRVIGPNVGVRFNYPLYDGGARRIKVETAALAKQQKELERSSTEEELVKELYNAFAIYQNTLAQWEIEKSNLPVFEQNLLHTQNRLKLGTATQTDVRTAQLNLNAAQNRISNYQFTIKQAEISLFLLSGRLVKS